MFDRIKKKIPWLASPSWKSLRAVLATGTIEAVVGAGVIWLATMILHNELYLTIVICSVWSLFALTMTFLGLGWISETSGDPKAEEPSVLDDTEIEKADGIEEQANPLFVPPIPSILFSGGPGPLGYSAPSTIPTVRLHEGGPRVSDDDRIFIDSLPDDLVKPFKEFTSHKADRLVADYIGKWIRWVGSISNVSRDMLLGSDQYLVSLKLTLAHTMVRILFRADQNDRLSHLDKGDEIAFEGKIGLLYHGSVDIKNAVVLH